MSKCGTPQNGFQVPLGFNSHTHATGCLSLLHQALVQGLELLHGELALGLVVVGPEKVTDLRFRLSFFSDVFREIDLSKCRCGMVLGYNTQNLDIDTT